MFPYNIIPVEDELNKELMNKFRGEKNGFVQVGPKKYLLPAIYSNQAEGFYNMKVRPDDIWIVTFPRCGTTMTQELIWLLCNNLDFETSSKQPLMSRFPFIDFSILHSEKLHEEVLSQYNNDEELAEEIRHWRIPGYDYGPDMKSPRFFKTHLPLSLLPPDLVKTCKVIYVTRNPKDAAVSYFHHNKLVKVHDFQGDFKEYWNYFEKGLLDYSPYFEHVKEAWELRDDPNMFFLFYEDLVQDMPGNIQKMANFLNKPVDNDQIELLVNHLDINNFKSKVEILRGSKGVKCLTNSSAQGFVRRGKVGGNVELTDELMERANKWIEVNLAGSDLRIPKV